MYIAKYLPTAGKLASGHRGIDPEIPHVTSVMDADYIKEISPSKKKSLYKAKLYLCKVEVNVGDTVFNGFQTGIIASIEDIYSNVDVYNDGEFIITEPRMTSLKVYTFTDDSLNELSRSKRSNTYWFNIVKPINQMHNSTIPDTLIREDQVILTKWKHAQLINMK